MKKIKIKLPEKTWQTIATMDVKYTTLSYLELMQWITDNVPRGVSLTDVNVSFDVDEYTSYYDEVITEAKMSLSVFM